MGIKGLLPRLEEFKKRKSLKQFSGQTVGVDTYVWLYRGTFTCADKICRNEPTEKHIDYVIKRVQLLLDAKITPIMIFDGGNLDAKGETELRRKERKKENLQKAMDLYKKGKKGEAFKLFQQSVSVTPKMAAKVIERCKQLNVSCLVAPYEADAQLAYLYKKKIIDFAISEDSDLICFGCEKVLYKMDNDGKGDFFDTSELTSKFLLEFPQTERFKYFRYLCILSGCDYLDNLYMVGYKTALKLLLKHKNIEKLLDEFVTETKKYDTPDDFIDRFYFAYRMFQNQIVFDIERLLPVELTSEEVHHKIQYLGRKVSSDEVLQIALGNLDPCKNTIIGSNSLSDFPIWNREKSESLLEVVSKTNISEYSLSNDPKLPTKNKSKYFEPKRITRTGKSKKSSNMLQLQNKFVEAKDSPKYAKNFKWGAATKGTEGISP